MNMAPVIHHPMPQRAMRAHVWDLFDEGLDDALEVLAELGVDGLHLAMLHPGGRFFCPHNPRRTFLQVPDGLFYFQPSLALYEGIRPHMHPEFGSGAFVARVLEAAHDSGMTLAATVTLFNNLTITEWHPESSIVNALGDRLPGALCPANPAVRGFAQALVEDLAHQVGVDAVELQDFTFPLPSDYRGAAWGQMPTGPSLDFLLGLCFCEHCKRRAEEANLEVEALQRHVERQVRAGLVGDISERRLADEVADPYQPLWRYGAVRIETITSLLDDLLEAAEGSPALLQPVLNVEPDQAAFRGLEPHALRQRLMRATLPIQASAAATSGFMERYTDLLQLGRELAADIPLDLETRSPGFTPAHAAEACAQAGIDRLVFSHYGQAPADLLDWVGELAVRTRTSR